jgi:hypothetical protein
MNLSNRESQLAHNLSPKLFHPQIQLDVLRFHLAQDLESHLLCMASVKLLLEAMLERSL